MERAECSVFIGKYQILQMTWSPLQWRWSLLVQHGAWCWMQEEQLGGSRRNRPTDYLQLCWELSFLNIHIFNQLKRLSEHTDRRSAKKPRKQPKRTTLANTLPQPHITLVHQLHGKDVEESLLARKLFWLCFMIAIHGILLTSSRVFSLVWAAFHYFM